MCRSSLLAILLVSSCTSGPETKPLSPREQVAQDNSRGRELAEKFEPQLAFRRDQRVDKYLKSLTQRLLAATPNFEGSPVDAFVIKPNRGICRNYGLPGIRIYLCAEWLKRMEFESQLAGAIAFELAHVVNRHHLKRIESGGGADQNRPGDSFTVFGFTEEEQAEAIRGAVQILYKAGFDPRGLVSVWDIYGQELNMSPYVASSLDDFKRTSREAINTYSPLMNPVVQTSEFISIQKRIESL